MNKFRFTKLIPTLNDGKTQFDKLFEIFQEILIHTSGDVAEGLKILSEIDRKYQLTENNQQHLPINTEEVEESSTWLATYKPILLIFAFITGITMLNEWVVGDLVWMRWMSNFMAGFFLVFSFFKLLNLKGFAESYSMYDVIAKKWNSWGYVYAFIELALGIAFLTGFNPILTNSITFIVMSVSIIGVLQSVFNKRKIKCACLGDVFNLPMSTITIIEDALMIGMSAAMLLTMLL
jgi:hypothetical protein